MRVLFLSPGYPAEMIGFVRGLAEVGVGVWGVGDTPRENLSDRVKPYLVDYLTVPRILDEGDVMERVSNWLRGMHVDRVFTHWEPLVMLAARLRERWGTPGMSVDTARRFRDKELMKERLREAGLRVPRSRRVRNAAEVHAAVEEIGYPLVLKPIAGAGCANTYAVRSAQELDTALSRLGNNVSEASCEEYIEGEELTYDTICMRGEPKMENVSVYLPKPLEASTVEWLSPMSVSIRDLSQPRVSPGVTLGRAVLGALGMDDGFTHMEWYRTPSGEAVFGEIACRAGGAGLVDQMNYTCDADFYREWARVTCWGHFEGDATRKYNVAMVFKRARGWGNITRIEGLGAWLHECGHWVVEERLSRPGTPRRDWRQTQRADGHLMVRHPDWDEVIRMANLAATQIQIHAQ
ncbi:MAG: ATP-grasp domain-containing protein [Myxococcales bacterium]|nr:ATP-grasp domain-containing protein [Myxococcales bacterium]